MLTATRSFEHKLLTPLRPPPHAAFEASLLTSSSGRSGAPARRPPGLPAS